MAQIRKLFRTGNSTVLAIPSYMLEHIGAEAGDEIYIAIESKKELSLTNPKHAPSTSSRSSSQKRSRE